MKRTALVICSILLILVSLFGLVAAGLGIKDGLAIKKYKEEDSKAADVVGELEKNINELKKNEQAYLDGIVAYNEGLAAYADGKAAYSKGQADLAAGQAQIDANTQAYNEGKALLEKIQPLMPYLEQYKEFRDGNLANLPGFSTAQGWFMAVVRPVAARMGLSIPDDVTDFPAYMQDMVAQGQALLKQYEDGLAALEQGKKDLASGAAALKEGEAALAAGKADIDTFEGYMVLVDEYTMVCFKNSPVYRFGTDEIVVDGPEQMLGSDYSWYKLDENGQPVIMLNGAPYPDLDKCLVVCSTFRQSVDNHVASVEHELYMRLGLYIAMIITCILGVVAGVRGIFGKGSVLGIVTAVLAIAANVFGAFTGYAHYIYPTRDMDSAGNYIKDAAGEYIHSASGDLQFAALIVLAVAAVLFAVFAIVNAKKKAKAPVETDEDIYEKA